MLRCATQYRFMADKIGKMEQGDAICLYHNSMIAVSCPLAVIPPLGTKSGRCFASADIGGT